MSSRKRILNQKATGNMGDRIAEIRITNNFLKLSNGDISHAYIVWVGRTFACYSRTRRAALWAISEIKNSRLKAVSFPQPIAEGQLPGESPENRQQTQNTPA